jgi:glycosyltransferase involved in cell wall biosynthesis
MPNQTPFFSIVMPAYNPRELIHRPLLSLASQWFRDFELIIVDDASTEAWEDALLDFPWLDPRVVHCETNGGCGLARRRGVEEAIGEYVLFMDSDDFLASPLTLHTLHEEILKAGQTIDIVSSNFIELNEDGSRKLHDTGDRGWVHGKVYRRQFLINRGVEFPHYRYTEDGCFNMMAFPLADAILFCSNLETYVWAWNPKSIVRSQDYTLLLMQNDYPMGHLHAHRRLHTFMVETEARGLPEDHPDVVVARRIRESEGASVISSAIFLYVYAKGVESRIKDPEDRDLINGACRTAFCEMNVAGHINAITSMGEWVTKIQYVLVNHLPTVVNQEPSVLLDESFPAWLERVLADGTKIKRKWDDEI